MGSIHFHYQAYGHKSNPPLLFLHGFLGSNADWGEILKSFSQEYYTLSVDLPGHGRTVVSQEDDFRMENCALKLVEFLDQVHPLPGPLVSYSMGGRLAFYLALNYPRRFNKIIIESASPGLKDQEAREERIKDDYGLIQKLQTWPLERFLDYWYSRDLFKTLDKNSARFKQMVESRLANDAVGLALSLKWMGTGVQPALWSELDKIQSDVLLIAGENDAKFKRVAREVAGLNKKISLRIMKGAGHNTHWENSREFIQAVSLFLNKKQGGNDEPGKLERSEKFHGYQIP